MNQTILLLFFKIFSIKNRLKNLGTKEKIRFLFSLIIALGFWFTIFFFSYKLILYLNNIEIIGEILLRKLLSMVFITFFAMLIFSNIITTISTLYLSKDLPFLFSSPLALSYIFFAKYVETTFSSSWMVLFFGSPFFVAFGMAKGAGIIYYLWLIPVIISFIFVTSGIGVIICMVLVRIFPANKTKNIFLFLSIGFTVALYLLFRFLQPEKLVNPESFHILVDYLSMLKTPSSPLLPSRWAEEAIVSFIHSHWQDAIFYLMMLFSSALFFTMIAELLANQIYIKGWAKSQEGKKAKLTKGWLIEKISQILTFPFKGFTKIILSRDIKLFFRDATQWSQLFMLFALIVVYVFNFSVLPLDKAPIPILYMQNLLAFLNIGLAGFVIAAVGARFVFPAVSLEKEAFWIIQTAPISLKQFLWSKFLMLFFPLLILAELLVFLTNYFLNATDFLIYLSSITIFLITIGVTSLGIGMGAIYPKFNVENVAQISTGYGGIIYMIISIAYIGIIIALEAYPAYKIFMFKLKDFPITFWQWIWIFFSFGVIIIIELITLFLPIYLGEKKLSLKEV